MLVYWQPLRFALLQTKRYKPAFVTYAPLKIIICKGYIGTKKGVYAEIGIQDYLRSNCSRKTWGFESPFTQQENEFPRGE